MAIKTVSKNALPAQVRITSKVREELENIIFSRYPEKEWATFFVFGVRETSDGSVITIADLLTPNPGDLNPRVSIVEFQESYSVRAAVFQRSSDLFIGVIHSHPKGIGVYPSALDDDMDGYYREYFSGFSKAPVYFSLIAAKDREGAFVLSGRGWIDKRYYTVRELVTVGPGRIGRDSHAPKRIADPEYRERLQRLYGDAAATRLLNSSVVIAGCSGTGSPAAEVLARAGIGRFILVDPERLDKSNLERVHGSYAEHFSQEPYPYKVEAVRELILKINPAAEVTAIVGNILQEKVRDHLVSADLLLCCTDTNHSRAGTAELAYRYLLPGLDIGVRLEGQKGSVSHEVGQVTVYAPGLPCAYCLDLIDPWAASVELMSDEEKKRRKHEAELARERGDNARGYWRDMPGLPTVGHFTALAGALIAGYAIGWLTGAFFPPRNFFQFDILGDKFDFIGLDLAAKSTCCCQRFIGHSDQAGAYAIASAPEHWPKARIV